MLLCSVVSSCELTREGSRLDAALIFEGTNNKFVVGAGTPIDPEVCSVRSSSDKLPHFYLFEVRSVEQKKVGKSHLNVVTYPPTNFCFKVSKFEKGNEITTSIRAQIMGQ